MKKYLLAFALILGLSSSSFANDSYSRDVSVLPQAAQHTLATNFKAKVALIKIDKTMGITSEYEAILNDGSEVTFDTSGNWKEIEAALGKEVPKSLVPQGVQDYVSKNFKGQKIISIEKRSNGYEVEVTNGVEMRFDKNGNFIRYND